jgi:hypothetical protein
MKSHCVAQAGIKLLSSRNPPEYRNLKATEVTVGRGSETSEEVR